MKSLALVERDWLLKPYQTTIQNRLDRYVTTRQRSRLLDEFTYGHHFYGFTRAAQGQLTYREWAPAAKALSLIGDFNGWDRRATPLERDTHGTWSVTLSLPEGSRVKVHVHGADGSHYDRLPVYLRRAVQNVATRDYIGEIWLAPTTPPSYAKHTEETLRIYEAHVGMAQEAARVGTFSEFTEKILPRIVALGYNTIQLMAVQEHPYYGSFGYHVSSFFGVSSRFGTPDELRTLIAEAHRLGLRVLMDLVHSHAVKNILEGLARFDGTPYQYFHNGPRGYHKAWDSLCFDYAKVDVQRFLLSNIRYWLEEYGFDGFRFDGVTSMLYLDHGLGREFSHYDDYFGANVDPDALLYLQLANAVTHEIHPAAITIAEDMSGMPGMARPILEGGLGFDYRLAMGGADFWIKTLKERADESWSMGEIWKTLTNRRRDEKHVGYAESHDQSIVGDKTLLMWLLDAAIYTDMALERQSLVADRGMALHKLIRLLTRSLAGEAWLNFMGNEFGHPEWVDFPREGNGWSHEHAQRHWSLVDSPFLRYQFLNNFDAALMRLPLTDALPELLALDEAKKLLVWRRGALVFAVNLHPTQSLADLRIPVPEQRDYQLLLDTDQAKFCGKSRITERVRHIWQPIAWGQASQSTLVYLPARCGIVLAPVDSDALKEVAGI